MYIYKLSIYFESLFSSLLGSTWKKLYRELLWIDGYREKYITITYRKHHNFIISTRKFQKLQIQTLKIMFCKFIIQIS